MESKLTMKRKKFCDEYIRTGNKTEAYLSAYAKQKRSSAESNAGKLLGQYAVKKYLEERMAQLETEAIASASEVLEYLTSVLRGESESSVVVTEFIGEGVSVARTIKKTPDEKERLRAAELLGRRYRLYTDKVEVDTKTTVIFDDEEKLED